MSDDLRALASKYGLSAEVVAAIDGLISDRLGQADTQAPLSTLTPPQDATTQRFGQAPEPRATTRAPASERYEDLGLLGVGGMGEVRRVREVELNRTLAMKVMHEAIANHPDAVARFVDEAQCSAQLNHPGLVPVHELGVLEDGRLYFTMAEVQGRKLADVIRSVHAASTGSEWQPTDDGWSFRRLVDAFQRACDAVAYAHGRGVIHRDLKPDNILVGAHGEVLVVDWGLAKVIGQPDRRGFAPVITERSQSDSLATQVGQVAGTPTYMPPEQARGDIDRIDARSDVYALGAVLYEILSGQPPYKGKTSDAVLHKVISGPPELAPGRSGMPWTNTWEGPSTSPFSGRDDDNPVVPPELVSACVRAMARDPADRFANAAELRAVIRTWVEGTAQRDQALEIVDLAARAGPESARLARESEELMREAKRQLADVPPWAPESAKYQAWEMRERSRELESKRVLVHTTQRQLLQGALQLVPTLPEAHQALVALYQADHEAAEAVSDVRAAARAETLLKQHLIQLPRKHPARRQARTYLRGDGALTLLTDPPGAEVVLHSLELVHGRLLERPGKPLGTTPLDRVPLKMGSYVCRIRHPDCEEVVYPVHISRGQHWHGEPPGALEPAAVPLPRKGELGPDERYVPPGWYLAGGPSTAGPRGPLWCDGFVMQRFCVTNGDFIRFLDALVDAGRADEALKLAPRQLAGKAGEDGPLYYAVDEAGHFHTTTDAEGDTWHDDWPVLMAHYGGAVGYASWLRELTGKPWRLPHEYEWEKAARGVDQRKYPWGTITDPTRANSQRSREGRPMVEVVDSFPIDCSVYGVRGLAGNCQCWCSNLWRAGTDPVVGGRVEPDPHPEVADMSIDTRRAVRGGAWHMSVSTGVSELRKATEPAHRTATVGIRLVRSWPDAL